MGAVLDHPNAARGADLRHRVHVGHVAAHMAEEEELRPRRISLRRQVVDVDSQPVVDLHQHRFSARMGDGAGHGRKREGVQKDLVARFNPGRFQRKEESATA